jgi:hypothetical protein
MDNEFRELIKEAKELYPENEVIKAYENNCSYKNLKELKRNLIQAIKRKKAK